MLSSISASPTADGLRRNLEPTLTTAEQSRLGWRIGSALVAGALLVVGWTYTWLFPDQEAVAGLVLFIGAIIAASPVFAAALKGSACAACATFDQAKTEPIHAHTAEEAKDKPAGEQEHHIMDQLISIAVLAAIATGDYTVAIMVPLLMAIGHFLEERSVLGAQAAIEGLRRLRARDATRIEADGSERTVAIDDLHIGDTLVVRPGEIIPADGKVTTGHSAVDQSAVTGESVPEDVAPGSQVFAGTLNVSGMLNLEVTELAGATAIGKVLELLREAERSKAPITVLLERYASYYMPFVLIIAGVTLILSGEVSRAVAVLVVACPCALVLSSSTAMVAALAVASRLGILIKNSRFLEVVAEVQTLILDKTGTLTLGKLDVVDVRPVGEGDKTDILKRALLCAYGSRHPISRAVAMEASRQGMQVNEAPEIIEHPGKGVEAKTEMGPLRLGNAAWIGVSDEDNALVSDHVGPVVWVANDKVLGAILLADRPRPEARRAVQELRELGVHRTLLVTGDRAEVAEQLSTTLTLDEFRANLLPQQKLEIVEAEVSRGERVMAVGDGVNDALALARADVGVAMGAMGSDAAIQSADIALMGNDISRLSTMVRLSRATRKTINGNVAFGISTAIIMIGLASAGYVGAIVGALLHNIGAVVVVANSARLLRMDIPDEVESEQHD